MYLSIRRGDTKFYKFKRRNKNNEAILEKADRIYFTVKDVTKQIIFQKTIDDMSFDEEGVYHFIIEPEDTDGADFGDYDYDLEVIANGIKRTLALGTFKIDKEVTYAQDEV